MRRGRKRQGEVSGLPSMILAITDISSLTATITSDGGPEATGAATLMTISTLPESLATASSPLPTSSSSTSTSSASPAQTSPPAETSSPPAQGIPTSLIPAIVVPIVVVALVAPIALYFFLTRHDRQRRKSRIASQISSRAYPDTRLEYQKHDFTRSSSERGAPQASEIMNFDLGPTVEKPLPVVNVSRAPDNAFERPDSFQVVRGLDPGIGQAVSRYSIGNDSYGNIVEASQQRTSIQELSEENMRIARLATDSKASFGARGMDEVSELSAPERISRRVDRRGIDELSNVSSYYEDETAASSDRGGGIFGNYAARRSGPLR